MAEVHEISRTALEELLVEGNLFPYSTLDELDEFELRDNARWLVVTGSVQFPDFNGYTYPEVRVYCCSSNGEFAVWLAEKDADWYLAHPEIRIREFEVWHVVDDEPEFDWYRYTVTAWAHGWPVQAAAVGNYQTERDAIVTFELLRLFDSIEEVRLYQDGEIVRSWDRRK